MILLFFARIYEIAESPNLNLPFFLQCTVIQPTSNLKIPAVTLEDWCEALFLSKIDVYFVVLIINMAQTISGMNADDLNLV